MVEACSLDLYPEENSWHFITVTPTIGDRVIAFAISVAITGTYFLVCILYAQKCIENTHQISTWWKNLKMTYIGHEVCISYCDVVILVFYKSMNILAGKSRYTVLLISKSGKKLIYHLTFTKGGTCAIIWGEQIFFLELILFLYFTKVFVKYRRNKSISRFFLSLIFLCK